MNYLRPAVLSLCIGASALAQNTIPSPVPTANPRVIGYTTPNVLSPELIETPVVQGSVALENPSDVFKYYGYNDNTTMLPTAPGSRAESRKTEPDKNVYLVLGKQKGADATYNYGTHFLFQGHELGSNAAGVTNGYLTRVNLDADGAHKVTLMGYQETSGTPMADIDGITWYPFAQKLLLTSEGSAGTGIYQASLDFPSKIQSLSGIIGNGGYEGVQSDPSGRLILVEDVGGAAGSVNNFAKRPNSYIYRFIPYNISDLTQGGVLQALQVQSKVSARPIYFDFYSSPDDHILSQDEKDLHTYNVNFDTVWVTIHNTATDGTAPFSALNAARQAHATPFKRPENGQFRPGSSFSEFYFAETGDTDNRTQAGATYGGWGAIYKLQLFGDKGILSLLYNGDQTHAGFDNCGFWDADHIVFVEDAGDTLHTQRNGLDSAWLFDVKTNYSNGAQPIRILAEGRDSSATLDTIFAAGGTAFTGTFPNEGDNEITGWHMSDGDPTEFGLLGAKIPRPFQNGWRIFWTQQHGDNFTWEILSKAAVTTSSKPSHGFSGLAVEGDDQ